MEHEWQEQLRIASQPFAPEEYKFKSDPKQKGKILAYVDARAVQERLIKAYGVQNISFDFEILGRKRIERVYRELEMSKPTGKVLYDETETIEIITAVKGTLTIGRCSSSDVGKPSLIEGEKSARSDALKRCAVAFGVWDPYRIDIPLDRFSATEFVVPYAKQEEIRRHLNEFRRDYLIIDDDDVDQLVPLSLVEEHVGHTLEKGKGVRSSKFETL